jgi:predicted ABC-type ATPase
VSKQVLMIAGPNGAGKTTAAMTLLPQYLKIFEFVNADEIARGLNPLQPEALAMSAARVMLQRIDSLIATGKSFGFESTAAGLTHVQTLKKCKDAGYVIKLVFLWLPSSEMAIKRVARRVKNGGHSIAPEVIERRYKKGLHNLVAHYLPLADELTIYDNSQGEGMEIATKTSGHPLRILDSTLWQKILEGAHGN